MKTERYLLTKEGEDSLVGFLFPDNVLWWERRGWTVKLKPS